MIEHVSRTAGTGAPQAPGMGPGETVDVTGISTVSVEKARSRALAKLRRDGARVQTVSVISEGSCTLPEEGSSFQANLRVRVHWPARVDAGQSMGMA